MESTEERLKMLLDRYSKDLASQSEIAEMLELLNDPDADRLLEEHIEHLASGLAPANPVDWNKMWSRVKPAKKILLKESWWAAAAIFLVLATMAVVSLLRVPSTNQPVVAQRDTNDIAAPLASKAILELADGRKVAFEQLSAGSLLLDANIDLIKDGKGSIVYKNAKPNVVQGYNTISVPRGSRPLNINLLDGSSVWLNVASSITFPVPFSGERREVSITGEAYFEVVRNPRLPFLVKSGKMTVQVLGTEFNVKAYQDEDSTLATLVKGKIQVRNNTGEQLKLEPREQARMDHAGKMAYIANADVAQAIAWRKNLFILDNSAIEPIMRQVARWYDVEILYDGKLTKQVYTGTISRQESLAKMLEILEYTGTVQFRIEDKKVIVSAKDF